MKATRIGYFSYGVADLFEELVKGQIFVEIGGSREAVFGGWKDSGLCFDGLAIKFAVEKDYFFADVVAFVLGRTKKAQGIKVLLNLDKFCRWDGVLCKGDNNRLGFGWHPI